MALYKNGKELYKGAVLREEEHMWMDGMLEVHAVVWNMDKHCEERIQTGYYGADGCNPMGGEYRTEIEISRDVARDIIRAKKAEAVQEFCKSVVSKKTAIEKGATVIVERGRKVPKGTILNVFWCGEKPTYRSRGYDWMDETETIAGCHDAAGKKIWIKAEYLRRIDHMRSPIAAERRKFITAYVNHVVPQSIRKTAKIDSVRHAY